jgi:hypothetical protein
MKYLKKYKVFESVITKPDLVNKIKYLSTYLHNYMNDVNKFSSSNLNFSFTYNTELTINEIFKVASELDINSPDGFITAVANEFITWSNYFLKDRRLVDELKNFQFNEDYENYDDDYKETNKRELYNQRSYWLLYLYVGQTIKGLISGTIWDIPEKIEFTDDDKDFILDSLISDYDEVDEDYIKLYNYNVKIVNCHGERGLLIKLPLIGGSRWSCLQINNDSDFMYRLQSYFNGAIIIYSYDDCYKIYLPFYKI